MCFADLPRCNAGIPNSGVMEAPLARVGISNVIEAVKESIYVRCLALEGKVLVAKEAAGQFAGEEATH